VSELHEYLQRKPATPAPEVLEAIEHGPMQPAQALRLGEVDRLLDRRECVCETGWCTFGDGVGYVAVRTEMPGITAEMVDWWFDWHPREALRYRIWHPQAHLDNRVEQPVRAAAKPYWGTVHHPVEDVGTGVVHARIAFLAPSEMGFSQAALEHGDAATVVCGYAGDDRRHLRHTPMFHVFMHAPGGLVLRSRFWLGAAIAPYGPLAAPGGKLLNNRLVRRVGLPSGLPRALARHCAEEYANLAALLGELYERFGPRDS
jgi:hypothetical protein